MSRPIFYNILNLPWIFKAVQRIVAPGGEADLLREIKAALSELPGFQNTLDVGCGPSSWLWHLNHTPVGLDNSPTYVKAYRNHGGHAMLGSADSIPFDSETFDAVWSFALFHHLDDLTARKTIKEMIRVCKPQGFVFVFDSVLPRTAWRQPLAWLIRRLDRGENMRTQAKFETLLSEIDYWKIRRFSYSKTGLEGVFCVLYPRSKIAINKNT